MITTDLHVGHPVEPMAGETEIWPTLAVAPIGTTVTDDRGQEADMAEAIQHHRPTFGRWGP